MGLDFLKDIVQTGVRPFYEAATLHKTTLNDNGKGGLVKAFVDHPVMALVDAVTETMRQEEGFSTADVAVSILNDPEDPEIVSDDEITVDGQRYKLVGTIYQDPVKAHFLMRGSPIG